MIEYNTVGVTKCLFYSGSVRFVNNDLMIATPDSYVSFFLKRIGRHNTLAFI